MMKQLMSKKSIGTTFKKIISFLVFAILLLKVFLSVTYLFRNSGYDREHVLGIKEESALDMVYIGGSDVFVYWEPLKAWNDYGFTSYNLATNTLQAESIKYYIKHALRYHKPDLFVISARAFQYCDQEGKEAGLRNSSDSLDFSLDRMQLIYEYLNNRTLDTDAASLYIDIAKYHTNYDALGSQTNWRMINNMGGAINKGFEWQSTYQYLNTPNDFQTCARGELLEANVTTLYDLLDFCKENELQVLFVVCPYEITKEHQEKYNTISDIVLSYGYDFLNANEYYDEMGIDFSTDFYNGNHVNCYGAEKYTVFLEKYIDEHFDLPDHRGESEYTSWDEDALQFLEEEKVKKQRVDSFIAKVQEGKEIAENIHKTTDFLEWCTLAKDSRFTILAVGNESLPDLDSMTDMKGMRLLGLDVPKDNNNYMRVVSDAKTIYTNAESRGSHFEAAVGVEGLNNSYCTLENSNGELSIIIDGEEYSRRDEGINVVVFENDYRCVIDSVTLKCDEYGRILLVR